VKFYESNFKFYYNQIKIYNFISGNGQNKKVIKKSSQNIEKDQRRAHVGVPKSIYTFNIFIQIYDDYSISLNIIDYKYVIDIFKKISEKIGAQDIY